MKKKLLFGLVSAAILSTSSLAFATSTSPFYTINKLEIDRATGSYFVTLSTPFFSSGVTCDGGNDVIEIGTTVNDAAKELINRTLLAAFLAGRRVSVMVSSTMCGATHRPALYGVTLDAAQ